MSSTSNSDMPKTDTESMSDEEISENSFNAMSEDDPEYFIESAESASSDESSKIEVYKEFSEYSRGKPFLTVNSIHTYLRKNCSDRISRKASAALIGVIQSIMCDLILEIQSYMLHRTKEKRIKPRIISRAIQADGEFTKLLSNVDIPESGPYGYIKPYTLKHRTEVLHNLENDLHRPKKSQDSENESGTESETDD